MDGLQNEFQPPRSSSRSNFCVPQERYGFEGQEYVIPRPQQQQQPNQQQFPDGEFQQQFPVEFQQFPDEFQQFQPPIAESTRRDQEDVGGVVNEENDQQQRASRRGSSASSVISSVSKSSMKSTRSRGDEDIEQAQSAIERTINTIQKEMRNLKLENEKLKLRLELSRLEREGDSADYMDTDEEEEETRSKVSQTSTKYKFTSVGGQEQRRFYPTPKQPIIIKPTATRSQPGSGHGGEFHHPSRTSTPVGSHKGANQERTDAGGAAAGYQQPPHQYSAAMESGTGVPYQQHSTAARPIARAQTPWTRLTAPQATGAVSRTYRLLNPATAATQQGEAMGGYPQGNPAVTIPDRGALATGPSDIDKLAAALVEAVSSQNKASEKFIARQSSESRLPTFTGNPLDWPLFINHYHQSTMDCGYTPAQNMGRLEKCIKGEARRMVQALMIVPNNADQVVDTLGERYGRPEYIIKALVDVAKATPAPRETKLASILDYSNAINNLVISIEAMDVPEYIWNPHLMAELVEKLPDGMKLQWGKYLLGLGRRPTLRDFARWISEEAKAVGVVTMPRFSMDRDRGPRKGQETYAADEEVEAQAEPPTREKKDKSSSKCAVCKEEHTVPKCDKFVKASITKKWDLVKKHGLCFRCLRGGHPVKDCRSKAVCGVEDCKRWHHKLLHKKEEPEKQPEPVPVPPEREAVQEDPDEQNLVEGCSRGVLLRVVPVVLYGREGKAVNTVAIFDECSTATVMSEDLREQLELDGPTDPLRLKWTNGQRQEHSQSKRLSCFISEADGGKRYKMKNVRTVKELDLNPQSYIIKKLVERWPHLARVKLPDMKNLKPELLIGQQHQHLIIARRIIEQGEDDPMLTRTKLGWVIHGPTGGSRADDDMLHCEHETSVADDETGAGEVDLKPSNRWRNGPTILKFPSSQWPVEIEVTIAKELLEEKKIEDLSAQEKSEPMRGIPEITKFSKWNRLRRATAYVVKLAYVILKKECRPGIHTEHLEKAEEILFRAAQQDTYGRDIELLKAGKQVPKSSQLYQLSPFVSQDGVLRMNARTVGVDNLKEPIILHPKHHMTRLLIIDYHVKALHQGQDHACRMPYTTMSN